jgi:hypothetical protein
VQSPAALELHGETSLALAKQSYQVELVDDKREDRELPLLGLPPGSDWVLHSCGFDPTCTRNVLAYTLARQLGHYAPRTRFVELVVDGDYRGLYVLIDRVRRDNDRIDLPRPADSTADGDITGGYVFRMDLGEGLPSDAVPRDWVSPVTPTIYSFHYPRFDRITAGQQEYLRDFMMRFETMMRSDGWNDPQTGYRRWLDLDSWVDFALLQELSMNPDAYFKSIYLQKWPRSRGDRLAIGPIWDFDLAFGAVEFRDARNTQAWAYTMNRFGGVGVPYDPPGTVPYVPEYWERLWSDPPFQRDLRCRWQQLRASTLRVDVLNLTIEGWAERLAAPLARDAARWPDLPKNSYKPAIGLLKEVLGQRLEWMDASLPGTCGAERKG